MGAADWKRLTSMALQLRVPTAVALHTPMVLAVPIAMALALPMAMWLLSALVGVAVLRPETARKVLHIQMGLIVLSFPWSIGRPGPVLALLALAGGWLWAVRQYDPLRRHFGGVLYAVGRDSWGEIYFVAGSGFTYLLAAGDALRFALPMMILIFADSAAAWAGTRAGAHRLRGGWSIETGGKSIEGCTAFFVVAFCCSISLLVVLGPSLSGPQLVAIALPLALATMLLEAVGGRGSDNFLIPAGAAALLPLLENAKPLPLALCMTLLLAAGIPWWAARRWVRS